MAAKHKMTVSVRPTAPRASSAERRAAQIAALSGEQAELKREAAERRRNRGPDLNPPSAPKSRKSSPRRSNAL
jgi:hypothetical protein